jgi:hypothetical protein
MCERLQFQCASSLIDCGEMKGIITINTPVTAACSPDRANAAPRVHRALLRRNSHSGQILSEGLHSYQHVYKTFGSTELQRMRWNV